MLNIRKIRLDFVADIMKNEILEKLSFTKYNKDEWTAHNLLKFVQMDGTNGLWEISNLLRTTANKMETYNHAPH